MFEKKLEALDFYSPNNFNYHDETVFRNFVSWLENQKIRLYKVEDRLQLDNVENDSEWQTAFSKYLKDLQLNDLDENKDREYLIERLLSHAIRLEYSDNVNKYNSVSNDAENSDQTAELNNYLENIDCNSVEFKEGINRVQRLLNVPSKLNDVTSVLQALAELISQKLNPHSIQDALNNKNQSKSGTDSHVINLVMDNIDLGFDTNDKILNDAAKILRLLHIKELRNLQTKINETIALIQGITANPKTDTSLGKVGK